MKKSLVVAVSSLALASSAFSASQIKLDETHANSRIIFAAQFPNKAQALQEGIDSGASLLSAEAQCYSKQKHYEDVYGKGACEKIRELAPDRHALESRGAHIFWCYVAPAIAIKMLVVSAIATYCGIKAYNKHKRE